MKKLLCLLMSLLLCLGGVAMAEDAAAPALSENIYDFQVEIEGVVYQLPMHVKNLLDNGWAFADKGETLQPNHYTLGNIEMKQGNKVFDIALYNPDIVTQPFENCYVIKTSFDPKPYNAEAPAVKFAKGITMAAGSDEIKAAYGEPSDLYSSDTSYYMTYEYDIRQEYAADYYKGELTEMELYNFTDEMPNVVLSAYDPNPTEVYGRYAAHEDDGTLFGHSFTVDGVSYQLLTPVQTFIDNGWTVKNVSTYLAEDYVAADSSCRVELFKNNQTMDVYVKNYEQDRAAKVAYCFVTEVSFDSYDLGSIEASVPGFKLGMTADEANAALAGFSYVESRESSYSTSHRVSQFEEGSDYMTLYVNNEKGIVSEITVEYRPQVDELPF